MVKHHPNLHDTIDEMWLLDAVNQGDSALINEGYLGDACKSYPMSLIVNRHFLTLRPPHSQLGRPCTRSTAISTILYAGQG
jgi:hypothetical protein